jgi:hypothetical protein
LGTRLVDDEVTVPEQPAVQHFDRLGCLFLRGHLDESEPPGPPGELVRDDPDRLHDPRLLKELPEILLCSLEGEVTDEKLCGHRTTS